MIAKRSFLSEFFSKFFTPAAPKIIPTLFVADMPAMDGTDTLYGSPQFTNLSDPYIKAWKLDRPGEPTPAMRLIGTKITKGGTFADIFSNLSHDLNTLRVSQGQINLFSKRHYDKFDLAFGRTLMLFSRKDEPVNKDFSNLFVAVLYTLDAVRELDVEMFENRTYWEPEEDHQVVIPEQ